MGAGVGGAGATSRESRCIPKEYTSTSGSSDRKIFAVELLSAVLVVTTAFGSEVFLRCSGMGVKDDRGFSCQAGHVTVALTALVSSMRTGVSGKTLDDSRRVPNLASADDSLLYIVTPGVGLLRTPFWVGTGCRCFEVTGFWRVILSAPQYEKLI